MAEAIGLAASVFATVQIADRVISLCKRYIESIQDAPSDLRTILIETSSVKAILENVKVLIECDNGQSDIFDTLKGPSGPIEGCREAMKSLEGLFRTDTAASQGLSRSRKLKSHALVTLATLAWPLKESKAKKLLQDVATHKSTISLALAAGTAHLVRDTARKATQIQDALSKSRLHEVFKWLEDIDPSSLHHQAQDNHEPGTCDWATRLPEWPDFLNGGEHCLWIHGIPGAGKTILASQLIEQIEEHCSSSDSENLLSIYYYCYFGHNRDESIPLLKWILNRLCRESDTVSTHLWKLFKHGGTPSLSSLLVAIEYALEHFDVVYITVDAIDESKPRKDLLKTLRYLATDARFDKIRLLLISREYFDIEIAVEEFSTSISMKNPFLDADIRLYAQSRVRKERHIKDWPAELQQEIVEALSHGAQGMFRWVVCQIDVLRRIKKEAVREALSRLPKTLNEGYDRIFEQIGDDDFPYVNSAMRWLCFETKLDFGRAFFATQTLAQAVDEDVNLKREKPNSIDIFHDTETLRELCGCLITVGPMNWGDGVPTKYAVSFAHYTVLEYLASGDRCNPDSFFSLDKNDLVLEQAKFMFERALCVPRDEAKGCSAVALSETDKLFSFGSYCDYTSFNMIFCFDAILAQHGDLFRLALDILDSRKPHFTPMSEVWSLRWDLAEEPSAWDKSGPNDISQIEWESIPDVEVRILVTLLSFGCVHMSRELLERMRLHKSFQACLDFTYDFRKTPTRSMRWDKWLWSSQEIPTNVFAALFSSAGIKVFELIGSFDWLNQDTLIQFGRFHDHSRNCGNSCVMKELLKGQEIPSFRKDYITPLQIAVASFDIEGVTTLLQAGADPNAEGCTTAQAWPERTAYSDFNILHGRHPLQICRQICDDDMVEHFAVWGFVGSAGSEAKTMQSRMEAALLEHGATE
ncbi:hypothetical protein CKAH01_02709 [Colletotrichum kahawae]|uniref:Nephrocystin 3-like N-terminal domain-containing protein n=1 Tax=Colletotrichum kahawae TaxID=34407 RepID=A0AAE0CXV0_COLKA|nr:hypothetical protein CKAH01_02709 [Colletotrichum kahawae]